ncbi:MAG: S-adenosylmethionine decarboxylase [Candidatus Thermoplasmatota archaeon]|nr:S-adenosylmethionine decarboxylase [Candidatus Thermoplasmatota archaeon]
MNYSEAMEEGTLWGILTSIDLFECDPEIINSEEDIKRFVVELCDLIEMKRYGECQVYRFGNGDKEGLSFLQLIETSLISGHLSNDLKSAYVDCFSCKYYDPEIVAEFSKAFFHADKVRKTVVPRRSKP